MPRLREVPRAEVTDERILFFYDRLFGPDRDPAVEHGTATGSPGDWWTVFAQSPEVFRHAVRGFALYRESALDPVLRELGQCRAGWARGSRFVFSQHCKQMRALGVAEDKIAALPSWQVADCYSPVESAVLAYTDALVLDGGRVPDAVFDLLREHLTEPEILQLTYITCMYEMHATIAKALRLEFDDRPEPVTEVAAPDGYGTRDVAADLTGS
ncbi:carboxymuconolactone decarboxylase family protein [Saccharopolyspora sp. TS4A08]|uniref:Carboxymuconolactone decarboxylase family protein n=1 Tax=Saccharopolyspora ipomoeae TaxID=3042027 RepID=A0ABT6PI50_9PSEU|nr:carboxymuconolactone decarboxylase family protein [Saccharopolyspora sp. TS4A08]MDI2027673.1 carboxymuconolactone decarboxylase family protein [Saccharopolyspora sp. TS4A08]